MSLRPPDGREHVPKELFTEDNGRLSQRREDNVGSYGDMAGSDRYRHDPHSSNSVEISNLRPQFRESREQNSGSARPATYLSGSRQDTSLNHKRQLSYESDERQNHSRSGTYHRDKRQASSSLAPKTSTRSDTQNYDDKVRSSSSKEPKNRGDERQSSKFVKIREVSKSVSAKELFSACTVRKENPVSVTINRSSSGSSVAFVRFRNHSSARNAMNKLHGTKLSGRYLSLVFVLEVEEEYGITTDSYNMEDHINTLTKSIKELDKLLENRCKLFSELFVGFTDEVNSRYPHETSLERKRRIYGMFKDSEEKAYRRLKSKLERCNNQSVEQLMPEESIIDDVELEALFFNIIQNSERVADFRWLRTAWQREIKLPMRRHGADVLRLSRVRNFLAHILGGPLKEEMSWDEVLDCLINDLDIIYAEQAESNFEWDGFFESAIAKRQNPDDEGQDEAITADWYNQGN